MFNWRQVYSGARASALALAALALAAGNLQPAWATAPIGSSSLLKQTQTQNLPGIDGGNAVASSRWSPNTVVLNDKVYYLASTPATGVEMFTSDGTSAGTYVVKETAAGASSGMYVYGQKLTVSNNKIWYMGNYELWTSDGTAAGTGMLKDISTRGNSMPTNFTQVGSQTFFTATDSGVYYNDYTATSPGYAGTELWVSDGTSAGTHIVKDIYPGYYTSGSNLINNNSGVSNITSCNGKAFFSANDGVNGYELWSSDGTDAGTAMVKDIYAAGSSAAPSNLACVNNKLVFSANNGSSGVELWVSDGTSAGTTMLKDIYAGASGSSPSGAYSFGGKVYFQAQDGTNGYELWATDGTTVGTTMIKNINPGASSSSPAYFTAMGGKVYFNALDSRGGELWVTDGTTVGTLLVADINQTAPGASSSPKDLYAWNNKLYFDADNGSIGREPYVSDGTNSGTSLIRDMFPGISDMLDQSNALTNTPYFTGTTAGLFFTANSPVYAQEMWITNGTDAGTHIVVDANSLPGYSYASSSIAFNGKIYFAASSAYFGQELWTTDLAGNTAQMIDIYPGAPSGMKVDTQHNMVVFNNRLYFTARNSTNGYELWSTDGTVAGTTQAFDLFSSNAGTNASSYSGPRWLTVCNGKLYMNFTNNGNYELFVTDGTLAGTSMVKRINQTVSSDPWYLTCMNNSLYFTADDSYYWQTYSGTVGRELYKTDGTSAGTVLVSDINTGAMTLGYAQTGTNSANPQYLTVVNGRLFFSALNNVNENELYYTDGTTVTKIDVYAGASSGAPSMLVNYNGNLYFRGTTATTGQDMMKVDGTTLAITAVDVVAGAGSFVFYQPVVMGGLMWFQSSGEMWTSDGTAANTGQFEDLLPGGNSNPDWLVAVGGAVIYLTYDSTLGSQPRYILGNAIYTITFNGNSSTGGTAPADVSVMSVSASVPGNTGNLTRTGYSFVGWNTSPTGVGTSYLPGSTITPIVDTPLFAQWATVASYTITYDANGATSGVVAPAVANATTAFYLDTNSGNLAKAGYTFGGWNTLANGGGTNYASGARYTPVASVTLYAKWTALPTFSISFNANGATSGAAPASLTGVYSTTTLPGVGTMAKTGFVFAGWNTSADGLGTQYAAGETMQPQATMTLYAQWSANPTYTLTYNANGSTSGTAPAVATASSTYVVIDSNSGTLAKTGYIFSGWNTAADGSGTTYIGGNNYLLGANVTFYAYWIQANYTVTYSGNGSTGGSAPAAATGVSISTVTLADSGNLVKAGYTFVGWNTLPSGLGTDYAVGATFYPSSSTTLYAKWTALPTYTINYDGNGATSGGVPVAQTGIYAATTLDTNSGALAKSGSYFSGWNTLANGTGTHYAAGESFTPSANITLYAEWSATPTFTLSYDGNQKTGGVTPVAQTGISSTTTVLGNTGSLVRTGYRFDGWNTLANGTGTTYVAGATIAISVDTTLYALWTSVPTYTLSYSGNGQTTGSVPLAVTTSSGSVVLSANINVLTKTNYNFTGWNTAANGTGTHYNAGDTFTISANTTIYAEWTPMAYTVTYLANGATSGAAPAAVTASGAQTVSTNSGNLALTNYGFAGWNTAADGTGTTYAVGSSITPSGNTTLFAKWIQYTVTFSANSPTSGTTPSAITGYGAITLPSVGDLIRNGYSFGGWNTNSAGTGTNYAASSSYTPAANVTLYANWSLLPVYTITYNANSASSGTVPTSQSGNAGSYTLAANTGSLDRTGYVFDGWNTAANGSGSNLATGSSYSLSANVTLYAKWNAIYVLSFDGNGAGSGAAPTSISAVSSLVALPGNAGSFAKSGYYFGGWNTAANASGTSYSPGTYFALSVTTTLYVLWLPNQYTITYAANGASAGAAPSATTGAGTQIVLGNTGNLALSGYGFAGWNTQADGLGTNYAVGSGITPSASLTLYANWTALPTYSVTFAANGATSGSSPIFANSIAANVTLPGNDGNFALAGYYFNGWNTAANGSGTTYLAGSQLALSANTTLYALWAPSVRTITFDANGADAGSTPNALIAAPGSVVLPINLGLLARAGYVLVGWNTAANGAGSSYSLGGNFGLAADITLYAQWMLRPVYPIGANWISRNVMPLTGGQVTLTGFGFDTVIAVRIGGAAATVVSQAYDRIVLDLPALPAGAYTLAFIGSSASLNFGQSLRYVADQQASIANFLTTRAVSVNQLRTLDALVAGVRNFKAISLSVTTVSGTAKAAKANAAKLVQLMSLAQRLAKVYQCAVQLDLSFNPNAVITGIKMTFKQNGYSRSTTTGTWSLGPTPLRSLRSITARVTRSANGSLPKIKSMRMPSLRGKRSCW